MYTIDRCPCCQSSYVRRYPAVVAPFIAHYVAGSPPGRCNLLECRECSFRFYDSRLTPEEVNKLYSNYRGEEYFRARHRDEFWYSTELNQSIGHRDETITARKQCAQELIGKHCDLRSIETVLDYGGDAGQFIPNAVGREKFVFELSDAAPVHGVTKIADERALWTSRYDLVMVCHVLEHCSEPAAELQRVSRLARDCRALCYVEVPYERFSLKCAGRGRAYERYLDFLLRFPTALTAIDFYSAALRIKANMIPPLGILKCHEHLNFFNERSLETLLKNVGFEVLACRTAHVTCCASVENIVQGLARFIPKSSSVAASCRSSWPTNRSRSSA